MNVNGAVVKRESENLRKKRTKMGLTKKLLYLDFFLNNKNLNRFRVGYGYPWIIYSDKIRVWILMGIDIRVSMGKLFR